MIIDSNIAEIYEEVMRSEIDINRLYEELRLSLPDPDENDPIEIFNRKFIYALTETIKKNLELNIYDRNVARIIDLFRDGEFSAAVVEIAKIQDDPRYDKFKQPFKRLLDTVQLLQENFTSVEDVEKFITEKEKEEKFRRDFKPYYGTNI
jgi:hypothetical protein